MMSPSHTCPLCVSCFQSFLIVNALKRSHRVAVSPGWKTRSAAVIGSISPPPPKEAPFQHHCLNRGLSRAGWGSPLSSFLPRQKGVPLLSSPLFSLEGGITKHLYIVSGVRTPSPRDSPHYPLQSSHARSSLRN